MLVVLGVLEGGNRDVSLAVSMLTERGEAFVGLGTRYDV